MHVAHPRGKASDMEQQRGRDVVREISHEPHALGKNLEIKLERVGLMHDQFPGKFAGEARREIAVDLDGMQLFDLLEKRPRERALPGAHFDEEVFPGRIDFAQKALDYVPLVQEMLPEPSPRYVRFVN